jgi:hypothetical protein
MSAWRGMGGPSIALAGVLHLLVPWIGQYARIISGVRWKIDPPLSQAQNEPTLGHEIKYISRTFYTLYTFYTAHNPSTKTP